MIKISSFHPISTASYPIFSRVVTLLFLFSLNACISATDKCAAVVCESGRYCADGKCVCPEGYTGVECLQQIPPTSIRITKVEIIQYPLVNYLQQSWDIGGRADLLLHLTKNGNTLVWESPAYIENADSGVVHTFIPNPAIELADQSTDHVFSLYDFDDEDSQEFIGSQSFKPYNSSNDFPAVLTLDRGDLLVIRVHLSYSW